MKQWRNSDSRYGLISSFFHWVMAMMIFVALITDLIIHNFLEDGPVKWFFYDIHKSFGITVFMLFWLRFFWLLYDKKLQPVNDQKWAACIASLGHKALYALMLLMPVSGYIGSKAGEYPANWFGLDFGIPIPVSQDLHWISELIHEIGGYGLYFLLSAHIGAALFHQYYLKDQTLKRML